MHRGSERIWWYQWYLVNFWKGGPGSSCLYPQGLSAFATPTLLFVFLCVVATWLPLLPLRKEINYKAIVCVCVCVCVYLTWKIEGWDRWSGRYLDWSQGRKIHITWIVVRAAAHTVIQAVSTALLCNRTFGKNMGKFVFNTKHSRKSFSFNLWIVPFSQV